MNNTIFLHGYWAKNFGDELFLELFRIKYPDAQIMLSCNKEFAKYYKSKGYTVLVKDGLVHKVINRICRTLFKKRYITCIIEKKADYLVVLGGSLFMQIPVWRKQYEVLTEYVNAVSGSYVIGANFGPFESDEFVSSYSKLFSSMTDVCFRDSYSAGLFKDLPNVRFADDISYHLPALWPQKSCAAFNELQIKDYTIISLINPQYRINQEKYTDSYFKLIDHILSTIDTPVVLFYSSYKMKDYDACLTFYNKYSERFKEVRLLMAGSDDLSLSIDIIRNAKCVIASHFHTMLIALLYSRPVLPLIYNEKMQHILEDLKYKGPSTDISQIVNTDDFYKEFDQNYNLVLNTDPGEFVTININSDESIFTAFDLL